MTVVYKMEVCSVLWADSAVQATMWCFCYTDSGVWLHVLPAQDGCKMSAIMSVFQAAGWRKRSKGGL